MVSPGKSVVEPRMVKILMLRGLGFNQREIADMLSISQQAVSYNLKLMKSKSEIIGPEKYFRSLLPYISEWKKPVIPGDSVDLINETIKELQNQLKKEKIDRNEEMLQARNMFSQINEKNVRLFENKMTKKLEKALEELNESGVDTDGED